MIGGRVARRLFIAFVLIVVVTIVCWFALPRSGLDLPWFVPLIGYGIILLGAFLPVLEKWREEPAAPRKRSIDEIDPGPGEEDLKRFGEPRLKLTETDESPR